MAILRVADTLTGRTRNPPKRSETGRLHSKMVDGVRGEGFLHTGASTKTLPAMHIGISRALRTLFGMITEVSKGEDSSESLSNPPGIISTVEFAISKFPILSPISLQRETAYYFLIKLVVCSERIDNRPSLILIELLLGYML